MSDDLLRAADARPDSVRTHWDGCYVDHDLCLIAKLAARVRDLEAELAASRLLVKEICAEWNEDCEPCCDSYGHDESCRAVYISAAKRALNNERDALRAEVERLRAVLRRVLSCGLNEEPHGAGFTPSRQERLAGELAADIIAALAQKEKP